MDASGEGLGEEALQVNRYTSVSIHSREPSLHLRGGGKLGKSSLLSRAERAEKEEFSLGTSIYLGGLSGRDKEEGAGAGRTGDGAGLCLLGAVQTGWCVRRALGCNGLSLLPAALMSHKAT